MYTFLCKFKKSGWSASIANVQSLLRRNLLWRQCLVPLTPSINPMDNGWTEDEDGNINILWMSVKIAPDFVLQDLSCKWKQERSARSANSCPCMHSMKLDVQQNVTFFPAKMKISV